MSFFSKKSPLLLLLLGVLAIAACSEESRKQRQTEARARQGLPAVEVAQAAAEENLSPGAQLYRDKTCNTCHGDDGIKPLLPTYPIIAKQGEAYALKQMRDIKSGARSNGQSAAMKPIVDQVTDEELVILAKFIAEELGADKTYGGDGGEGMPGETLYKTKTCVACHGADAKTPLLPEYAKLAGQNAQYVKQQLMDVKSGARDNGAAIAGMKGIMPLVSEEEMDQLAEYIAALPR